MSVTGADTALLTGTDEEEETSGAEDGASEEVQEEVREEDCEEVSAENEDEFCVSTGRFIIQPQSWTNISVQTNRILTFFIFTSILSGAPKHVEWLFQEYHISSERESGFEINGKSVAQSAANALY